MKITEVAKECRAKAEQLATAKEKWNSESLIYTHCADMLETTIHEIQNELDRFKAEAENEELSKIKEIKMLTSDYPRDGAEMKMPERCQPDYETMIARLNERLNRETKMRDALLEYLKGRTVEGKMAEIVGEIVTRCNSFQCELSELIKRQEEDKK